MVAALLVVLFAVVRPFVSFRSEFSEFDRFVELVDAAVPFAFEIDEKL